MMNTANMRRFATVYFDNGHVIMTPINGTVQTIIDYYYLKYFNIGNGIYDLSARCIALCITEPQLTAIVTVRGQLMPKTLAGNTIVQTNRLIEVKRKVSDLAPGDEFLLDGCWYQVERVYLFEQELQTK